MADRIRRGTLTIEGVAVAGARNFNVGDDSEYDNSRADDEASGSFVRMTEGPYPFSFELLASDSNVVSDYIATAVLTYKEISVTNAVETSTDKTITLSDGYLKYSNDVPVDGAGRLPVEGQFKTSVDA